MIQNSVNDRRKIVGVWIRVSTQEQADGDSPLHHETRARAYAEARDWTVGTLYDLFVASCRFFGVSFDAMPLAT